MRGAPHPRLSLFLLLLLAGLTLSEEHSSFFRYCLSFASNSCTVTRTRRRRRKWLLYLASSGFENKTCCFFPVRCASLTRFHSVLTCRKGKSSMHSAKGSFLRVLIIIPSFLLASVCFSHSTIFWLCVSHKKIYYIWSWALQEDERPDQTS